MLAKAVAHHTTAAFIRYHLFRVLTFHIYNVQSITSLGLYTWNKCKGLELCGEGSTRSTPMTTRFFKNPLRGGPRLFFRRIHFENRAPQMPLVIGETFGEDLGPRRPTGSKPRPNSHAQNRHVSKLVIEGQMGHQTVPLIIQIYPI